MPIFSFDPHTDDHFTPLSEAAHDLPADQTRWIDVRNPTASELLRIAQWFHLHPLALEDIRKRGQRPKLDIYGNQLHIVIYALEPGEYGNAPGRRELAIVVTDRAVATIHVDATDVLRLAAERWAEHCAAKASPEPGMLLYTLLDTVVDGYFPVVDSYGERIDDAETLLFRDPTHDALRDVFAMKRELLELRKLVAPARELTNGLSRRELPVLGEHTVAYFQDIQDHIMRVIDGIDADRDVLSSLVDVQLSLTSNRLNETMKRLTSASIILMTLALIAGIYGMNFQHMPELTWRYGYFAVLGFMTVTGVALLVAFRRLKWW